MESKTQADMAAAPAQETHDCPAIAIENLSKFYGANQALCGISFAVQKGEIMGFLGPNGAGKSTAMNILTGYLAPGGGSVRIDGIDIAEDPDSARKKIGYLPEIPPLYTDMTVMEYLSFVYDLKGVKKDDKGAHLRKVMEKVHISDVKGRLIRNLSKGYRQRVGLAQALIGNPEVLVLDEPTVGLDPRQILEIREVISELGKNRTVILSTHILQEVSAVCDSYTIINHGRIVSTGRMSDLTHGGDGTRYLLRVRGDGTAACALLCEIDGVEAADIRPCDEENAAEILVTVRQGSDLREDIFRRFAAADCPILAFSAARTSLEETFMHIISTEPAAAQKQPDDTPLQTDDAAQKGGESA